MHRPDEKKHDIVLLYTFLLCHNISSQDIPIILLVYTFHLYHIAKIPDFYHTCDQNQSTH